MRLSYVPTLGHDAQFVMNAVYLVTYPLDTISKLENAVHPN